MEAPTPPKSGEVSGHPHLPNLSYFIVLGVSTYVVHVINACDNKLEYIFAFQIKLDDMTMWHQHGCGIHFVWRSYWSGPIELN